MKAYYIGTNDPDDGGAIVFAEKPSQAKNQIYGTDIWPPDIWLDIRATRHPSYDGMENVTAAELALKQWRDGWKWFDRVQPDPDESSDQEFLVWFAKEFGGR